MEELQRELCCNWWADLLRLGGAGREVGKGQEKSRVRALRCPGDPHQPPGAAAPLKLLGLALGIDVDPVVGTGDENR